MILLDGIAVARGVREGLAHKVSLARQQGIRSPHLAVVLVGDDPASHTYVGAKLKACQEVGFQTTLLQHKTIDEDILLRHIEQVNEDAAVDGLIVQLPLPPQIGVQRIIQHILPEKDVDGFHPINYGKMARGVAGHIPATPLGILMLLKHYQIETEGKHCVIVGRSMTVGAPLSVLLSLNDRLGNSTVTLCHSRTQCLADFTRQADILVAATGNPHFITADMVKEGVVVIDVGITRVLDPSRKSGYRLRGDVDFEQVAPRCSHITPVPGGVGPMTIAALLRNTYNAYSKTHRLDVGAGAF